MKRNAEKSVVNVRSELVRTQKLKANLPPKQLKCHRLVRGY